MLHQISAAVAEFAGALSRDDMSACSLPRPAPVSPAEIAALGDRKLPASALIGAAASYPCTTETAPEGALGVPGAQPGQQTAELPLEHAGKQSATAGQSLDTEAEVELVGPSASTPASSDN